MHVEAALEQLQPEHLGVRDERIGAAQETLGKPRNGLPQRGSLGPDSPTRGSSHDRMEFVSQRNQRIDRPPFDVVTPSPNPAGDDSVGTEARQLRRQYATRRRVTLGDMYMIPVSTLTRGFVYRPWSWPRPDVTRLYESAVSEPGQNAISSVLLPGLPAARTHRTSGQ